jgi:hypothetical protein
MRRVLALGLVAFAGACTFGGLSDYEIGECNPNLAKQDDPCDALNPANDTSCAPYQCNPSTRRCAPLPRDDDRDGVPSIACGGTDCDDQDKDKKPGLAEWCDQKDNDCNGVPDDNVDAKTPKQVKDIGEKAADPVITGESAPDMLGAWVGAKDGGGKCLYATPLPAGTGGASCALLTDETNLEPRQVFARPLAGGTAATIVATSPCTAGELLYRFAGSGQAGKATLGCTALGAALPALALAGTGDRGVGAFYAVAHGQRKDALAGCSSAASAPLQVVLIDQAKTNAASFGTPTLLAQDTTSLRPPAVLSLGSRVLLASPAGADVGVWLLEPQAKDVATVAGTTLPGLAGARAVSAAVRADGAGYQVAVVAELGCTPQKLALALFSLDAATGAFGSPTVVTVAPAGAGFATATSVAFHSASNEWLVTWLADGPLVRSQRVDPAGQLIGATADLSGFVGGKASPSGDLLLLKATQSTVGQALEFWFVPGACGTT